MDKVLIDADTLVYLVGHRVEKPVQWAPDLWTLHAHYGEAMAKLEEVSEEIRVTVGANETIMVLSDYSEPNWRNSIMPDYKMHRKPTRRPVVWGPLRKHIQETFPTHILPTLEGDDVLGMLMTSGDNLEAGEKVCVSIDKDLKTIPGKHYNYQKEETFSITPRVAELYHMAQTISGDPTDGYPGAPTWGAKRARDILLGGRVLVPHEHTFSRGARKGETETRWEPGDEGSLWEIVVSVYASQGLSEAVALQSAQVARICHYSDYDFEKGEVIPWRP